MVDRHVDQLAGVLVAEGLEQRGPVPGVAETQGLEGTGRFHRGRFVDEGLEDGVAADLSRFHRGVGAFPDPGVEGRHQIVDGGSVVLDLHQPEYVGVKGGHGRDDLRLLPLELFWGVGAAGPGVVRGEGGEVVQHVERGDPQVSLLLRGGGTGIAGRVVGARGRLQPVGTETVAQHAGQVRNLVAGAEVVVPGHRFPVRVDGGSGVLGAASVVDREAVRLVAGQQIDGGLSRIDNAGRGPLPFRAVGDFPVAVEVVGVEDGQGLRKPEKHAFVAFPVGDRQVQLQRGHRIAAVQFRHRGGGDLGLVLVLAHLPFDLHPVPDGQFVRALVVDEDSVAGGLIPVARVLDEHTAELALTLEIAGHHPFDDHGAARVGTGSTGALHRADRQPGRLVARGDRPGWLSGCSEECGKKGRGRGQGQQTGSDSHGSLSKWGGSTVVHHQQ